MKKTKTNDIIRCAIFVALIAIGAFIKIPIPVIPFTLQFLFTMLAGVLLEPRLGLAAVCTYIILGLMGVPIFTEGGGIYYIFKPSFGYIIGFAVGAYVTGKIAHATSHPSLKRLLAATFAGLVIVYGFGLVYLYFISNVYLGQYLSVWNTLLYGFLLVVPSDIILCILASFIGKRLIPVLNKNN